MFRANREHFPKAIEVAVAANQREMVDIILTWVLATVRGHGEMGWWDEMRVVSHGLVEAVRVVVKMSRGDVGKIILQVLTNNRALALSVRRSLVRQLYEDCVQRGNSAFSSTALYWK